MNEKEKTPASALSWDERYASGKYFAAAPHRLLLSLVERFKPGKALDLACGAGQNAIFLAENGWQVTAVDNSAVGLEIAERSAAEKGASVDFRRADLEKSEFAIAENEYDLICDFYYLQRDLFAAMKAGVRAGGIVAAAIHIYGDGEKAGRFALREGELKDFFQGFEILHYRETSPTDAGEPHRRTAEIVCRKK
jgi:SAM-dependent methyltransferase